MSAAVIPWASSRDERKVLRVLRVLEPQHRRVLRAYMDREPLPLGADLDESLAAFREEWAA